MAVKAEVRGGGAKPRWRLALSIHLCGAVCTVACLGSGGTPAIKEPEVQAPLAKMRVMQHDGTTHEIFATLAHGVQIDEVIDLSLFESLDPEMTLDNARERLGPPTGEWDDPFCRARIPFYERPQGKVSLCRYTTEGSDRWATVGYPRECELRVVFRDTRLTDQIVPWLPETKAISVHVLRPVGWGGVTVQMTRRACSWVLLSHRE